MLLKNSKKIKKVVIKIGSNVLTSSNGIRQSFFKNLSAQVFELKKKNIDVVLVSSGAIALAMAKFQKQQKPKAIAEKQAFAAIGQPLLMQNYAKVFRKHSFDVAQILLTHDDFQNRRRFLNARHALLDLLKKNIIPIINENDSVSVAEIQFGDNDKLSSYVAHLIEADLLIILSHVEGLYDRNPQKFEGARLVKKVTHVDDLIKSFVFTGPSVKGSGGMASKIDAAQFCMHIGIPVFITSGFQKNCILDLWQNQNPKGTFFVPKRDHLSSRKRWIGKILQSKGEIIIDNGAVKALEQQGRSLLASGVRRVNGHFERGDSVTLSTLRGRLIGRGLTSYSYFEIEKIKGKKSSQFEKILGYKLADEIIHKNDLVLKK